MIEANKGEVGKLLTSLYLWDRLWKADKGTTQPQSSGAQGDGQEPMQEPIQDQAQWMNGKDNYFMFEDTPSINDQAYFFGDSNAMGKGPLLNGFASTHHQNSQ